MPALAGELEVTRWGQANTGGSATGIVVRADDDRLPWNQRAAEVERDLRGVLAGYADRVAGERGVRRPRSTVPALSGFLLRHLDWLRHQPAAGEISGEIRSAVREAWQVIDRHPDTRPLGRCGFVSDEALAEAIVTSAPPVSCGAELRARKGATHTSCRVCRTEVDVAERLALMSRLAEDYLLTAAELTTAVTSIARPIPKSTISGWVAKERLVSRGVTDEGHPLYRVGDVLDLLAESPKGQKAG